MPTPKGYPSQEKDERVNPEYVTVSKVGTSKVALDVQDQSTVSVAASDAAEAGTNTTTIVATAHGARPGDRIRVTSGAQSGVEVAVEDTDANTITLQQTLSTALAPGDTFDILRPTSLTVSASGGISTSSGPIEFRRDAVDTIVSEDTVTPANSRPLPVKLTGVDGDVSINAANLNMEVQLDHDSANPDSVQIGDGTETANVNASNELQVADDGARTLMSNSIDANNSTTAPLGIGATFTGTATDVSLYAAVSIQVFADQDSAVDGMQFQFSVDNVNWDESNDFNLDASVSQARRFQFPVTAQYFRIVYTNGGVAQGAFRVQTILHRDNILTSIHRVDSGLTLDRSVTVTKSVISGETTAGGGSFVNVKVNPSGALLSEVEQTTHDNLNTNANIQVGDADVANGNPVPVSDAGGALTVDQATHDNLNLNANVQVGDADASTANPVPAQLSDGTETANVSTNNELQVRDDDAVLALQSLETSLTAPLDVIDVLDNELVDATTINGNAGAFVNVVGSLANDAEKVQIMDTSGQFMGVYTGLPASETLKFIYGPGSDQTVEVSLSQGQAISLRSLEASGPSSGSIAMNFIGPLVGPSGFNTLSTNFDGAGHVDIPPVAANTPTAAMSVFMWFKGGGNQAKTLASDREDPGQTRWTMFLDNVQAPYNTLVVAVSADGNVGANAKQYSYRNDVIADNTWHLVGFTFGTNTLKAYLDGSEITATVTAPDGTVNTLRTNVGNDLQIGAINSGGNPANLISGNIDEMTLWDKELSAAEVTELWNAGAVFDYSTHSANANLVGYYRMGDGDTFPTITDQTANSDGTMQNMASNDFENEVP